jgi:hypothetical protein
MAITARTPEACFDQFLDHVRPLVRKMLPTNCPMLCAKPRAKAPQDRRTLSLANPQHDDAVPLDTRDHGTVFLYMAQGLHAERKGSAFRLRTIAYWYKIFAGSPNVNDDAVIRWEYAKADRGYSGPCRHHVQFGKMAPSIDMGSGSFDLTRLHMLTGWVTMEEVFRFLVHDLGVQPPCGDEWPEVLHESERAFFSNFTDKGASGYNESK